MKMWYDTGKSDNHILIASRVRLARNLVAYPFSLKIQDDQAGRMVSEVKDKFFQQYEGGEDYYQFYDMNTMDTAQKNAMAERCTITPLLRDKKQAAGLITSGDESECIMLNEEDHVRIQAVLRGDALGTAYKEADRLDDVLSERLEYAYNHKYGFITSCPTSIGTGLRAAYIMHLPFMEKEKLIKPLADELNRLGFMLRNMYGDASGALGSIYILSNQRTLGMSEEDILVSLKNMMVQVTDHERRARERLLRKKRPEIEDMVYRSYGILKYGKMFAAGEAMNHLSNVRLGFDEDILKPEAEGGDIYSVMLGVLPATLVYSEGKNLGSLERHESRARYIHEHLPQIQQ